MKAAALLTLLISLRVSYGQDTVIRQDDSLQELLHRPISDSHKVKILEYLHFLWKNKSFARSIDYSKQSIEFSEKHKPPNYTMGLKFQLGYAYMQAGDAVRSLEIFHQIVNETEVSNPVLYVTALTFIGMNYENQGDIKTALAYQQKADVIYDRLLSKDSTIDRRGYLGSPQQLADLYLKNNQLDSALFYGQIGLRRLETEPLHEYNRYFRWQIKTTMGDIYSQLNEYGKANQFYTEAEDDADIHNSRPDLLSIYLSRARLAYRQKDLQTALDYAQKSYLLAGELNLLPNRKEAALFLKTIYHDMNNIDSALLYYDRAVADKDSMLNADIARKTDAMKFAEEKRSQELRALHQERAFQKRQVYFISGILLFLLVAGFFYYKNRLNQKANQLLAYENRDIFLQRDQLRREVERFEMQALKAQLNPHFIFNCLNSIDAFIYSNDKYRATTYLNKFAKLLRNILDSSRNNTVSLAQDIQSLQLYTDLEELRNNNKFETKYCIDESISTDEYMIPPLIIQPIVENAILHGLMNKKVGKGVLMVSVKLAGNKLHYHVEDNGIGRGASARIPRHKDHSYGMELTRSRIKLFNHEEQPSMIIEDLYDQDVATGTRVSIILNLQTA